MRRVAVHVRSPLPTLRALRDEARAAVESHDGDTGEAGNPAELARWAQLCRVLQQREGAVARAEAQERAVPKRTARGAERRRTIIAKVETRTREARSGTRVALTADAASAQRIAVCRGCDRPAQVRAQADVERLWREGWGSVRRTELAGWPRMWWCPACWVPPRIESRGGGALTEPGRGG